MFHGQPVNEGAEANALHLAGETIAHGSLWCRRVLY
jgi:hypothetical protein